MREHMIHSWWNELISSCRQDLHRMVDYAHLKRFKMVISHHWGEGGKEGCELRKTTYDFPDVVQGTIPSPSGKAGVLATVRFWALKAYVRAHLAQIRGTDIDLYSGNGQSDVPWSDQWRGTTVARSATRASMSPGSEV